MDYDFDTLINALSGVGVPASAAQTFASFQQVAEKDSVKVDGDNMNVDMSGFDGSTFDMSALVDACKEIKSNHAVEEKVMKSSLFMRHILTAYEEVVDEGNNGEEVLSERFLKRLKKSKKREASYRQNYRQNQSKGKGEGYNEKFNQKLMKKKRNLKAKSRMSIY